MRTFQTSPLAQVETGQVDLTECEQSQTSSLAQVETLGGGGAIMYKEKCYSVKSYQKIPERWNVFHWLYAYIWAGRVGLTFK